MDGNSNNPTYIIPLERIHSYLENPDLNFVGRTRVGNKIYNALKHACGQGGSFLVGGYRGVGKTLLVKNQVDALSKDGHLLSYKIERINIDLGVDNDINIKDVLCDLSENIHSKINYFFIRQRLALHLFAFLFVCLAIYLSPSLQEIFKNNFFSFPKNITDLGVPCALLAALFLLLHTLPLGFLHLTNKGKLYRKSKKLVVTTRYSRVIHSGLSSGNKFLNISVKEIRNEEPVSTRRIQQDIKDLYEALNQNKILILNKYFFPAFLLNTVVGKLSRTRSRHPYNSTIKPPENRFTQPKYLLALFLPIRRVSIQPLIIFDEIDKINAKESELNINQPKESATDTKTRKEKIDGLLGGMKALLNRSKAIFVFVAGREMVDAYHSESGYTSVLYEGVFQGIFYVPTLLSDHTDGKNHTLHSMISEYINNLFTWDCGLQDISFYKRIKMKLLNSEIRHPDIYTLFKNRFISSEQEIKKEHINNDYHYCETLIQACAQPELSSDFLCEKHALDFKLIRRMLIRFLALHSRGNCKRLSLILSEFIEEQSGDNWNLIKSKSHVIFGGKIRKGKPFLILKPEDVKRIFVSSKIYSLYDMTIARQLSRTDDKLVVSSLIAMLDIVKFHGQGFTREMLDRTVSGIDVHAEANLSSITDEILHSTFYSIVRRTSAALFQYRFYQNTEVEFIYLSKASGARASSFEYSLDAADPVRRFYLREFRKQSSDNANNSRIAAAKLKVVLGDIFLSERNYDKSFSFYTDSIHLLKETLRTPDKVDWRYAGGVSLSSHYLLIEVLLKKGLLEEIRENIESAIRIYREAQSISQYILEKVESKNFGDKKINSYTDAITSVSDYKKWLVRETEGYTGIRNFNMLTHSLLAYDYLCLKSGLEPRHILFQNLIRFDEKKTEYKLYAKIMAMHIFAGQAGTVVDKAASLKEGLLKYFRGRVQANRGFAPSSYLTNDESIYRDRNPYIATYTYGHACLCHIAETLREAQLHLLDNRQIEKTLKIENRNIANLKAIVLPWFKAVVEIQAMTSIEVEDSVFNVDKLHQFNFNAFKGNDIDARYIITAFEIIFYSAKGMEERGRYSIAAEMYSSIVLCWIGILEMVPWSLLESLEFSEIDIKEFKSKRLKDVKSTKDFPDIFENRSEWLSKVISKTQEAIQKSSNGAFNRERSTLFFLKDKDKGTAQFPDRVSDICDMVCRGNKEYQAKYASLSIWYRPNSSSYLLIFGLWEHYCRISIRFWLSKREILDERFDIATMSPPIGSLPRVLATYSWIKARYQTLRNLKKMKPGSNLEKHERTNMVASIFESFSSALNENRLSSRSDDPDTFPPKSIIYFNIYEAIGLYFNDNNYSKSELNELKTDVMKRISDSDSGMFKSLLVDKHLEPVVRRHVDDIWELGNTTSNAYRRKMQHRYYLYDDFEDPSFLSEWTFLKYVSAGSKLIRDTLKNNSKDSPPSDKSKTSEAEPLQNKTEKQQNETLETAQE